MCVRTYQHVTKGIAIYAENSKVTVNTPSTSQDLCAGQRRMARSASASSAFDVSGLFQADGASRRVGRKVIAPARNVGSAAATGAGNSQPGLGHQKAPARVLLVSKRDSPNAFEARQHRSELDGTVLPQSSRASDTHSLTGGNGCVPTPRHGLRRTQVGRQNPQ